MAKTKTKKGVCLNTGRTHFKIGSIPWNKGKKGIHLSRKTEFKKGQKHSERWFKIMKGFRDVKNPNWKGDKAKQGAIHTWLKKRLGYPQTCEHCGKTGLFGKKIDWANKNHKYKRNFSDWMRLCVSCHRKYDIKYNGYFRSILVKKIIPPQKT